MDAAGRESLRATLTVWTAAPTPVVLAVRVAASTDDAEERVSSGSVSVSSSDLELTEDGSRVQLVGMRFRGLPIPQGATIVGANLRFTVDETGSPASQLRIRGQATANAAAFQKATANLSARPTAAAAVDWSPGAWTVVGASGAEQGSPDLSRVVQEIVDRADWAPGNALALLVSGTGRRTAEAYDGSPKQAPLLEIDYLDPGGP